MKYKTPEENFWAGEFGLEYLRRNQGVNHIETNVMLFNQMLSLVQNVGSIIELGCNIGLNLKALHQINQELELCGYEINEVAAEQAQKLNKVNIIKGSILEELPSNKKFDLSFTKGVLIHINPDELNRVYQNLYNLSNRYILLCEYYNPTPVEVQYRGHSERLYKRDFAGEMMDRFNLQLVDYKFAYHRDKNFPYRVDDATWFLLEKQ